MVQDHPRRGALLGDFETVRRDGLLCVGQERGNRYGAHVRTNVPGKREHIAIMAFSTDQAGEHRGIAAARGFSRIDTVASCKAARKTATIFGFSVRNLVVADRALTECGPIASKLLATTWTPG